jgi:hypothetical protein
MSVLVSAVIILLALLIVAWFTFSLCVVAASIYYVSLRGRALEKELGFRYGSACLPSSGLAGYTSSLALVSVVDGGIFDRAGFRQGDVLPDESVIGLFRTLHHRRNQVAELAVVDGGPGPPFHERPRRMIRFVLPG